MLVTHDLGPEARAEIMEGFVEAVSRAGSIILAHRVAGCAVETKADHSPVTVADQESEAEILAQVRRVLGDIPVVAEESIDLLRVRRLAVLTAIVRDLLDDVLQAVLAFAICLAALLQLAEHEPENSGLGDGKLQIGDAHCGDAIDGAAALLSHRACVLLPQLVEAARDDRSSSKNFLETGENPPETSFLTASLLGHWGRTNHRGGPNLHLKRKKNSKWGPNLAPQKYPQHALDKRSGDPHERRQ